MAKTAAERMAASRARKRNSATPESATSVTKTERNIPTVTPVCQTCGGPVQHPAIVKCLKCCTGTSAPKAKPIAEPAESGPLSVYNPARWSFLQTMGYVWDPERGRGVRPDGIVGVPVPGDPAYLQPERNKDGSPADVQASMEPYCSKFGLLSVYSEQRWSFLQSRGFVWDEDLCVCSKQAVLCEGLR